MKQFKLNFKSIVQSKARWLLTLIAILTLGVGQMWGANSSLYAGDRLYIDCTNWTAASAKIKASLYGTNGNWWKDVYPSVFSGNIYYIDFDGQCNGIKISRLNPDNLSETWNYTAVNWFDKRSDNDQNLLTLGSCDNNQTKSWGTRSYTLTKNKYIYFDNHNTGWTTPHVRIGKNSYCSAPAMTRQAGTANYWSYKKTDSDWSGYHAFTISDGAGWTGTNNIFTSNDVTARTYYWYENVSSDITIIAGSKGGTVTSPSPSVDWYSATKNSGQTKYTVTWSSPSNGSLTVVKYNNDAGTSTTTLSSGNSVVPTQIIKITPSPNSGYAVSNLSVTGATLINKAQGTYYVTANCTISVTYSAITSKTIKIKDTDSWGGIKVYQWNDFTDANAGAFPGSAATAYNGSTLWYTVTLSTAYTHFIISKNGDTNTKSSNISIGSPVNGNCYTTTTGALPSAITCPDIPSVSTNDISTKNLTSATLGGNISGKGSDIISDYGYYYSTNSALSSSNLGVGTKVSVGTSDKSGSYSKSQTGLSMGTTYYVIAYATNPHGTGYGTVKSFSTTAATLSLSGTANYEAKTMTITPTTNMNSTNGFSGTYYVCCSCTSKPGGATDPTITWNSTTKKLDITGANTNGDYTFNVKLKPASNCSGDAFNNADANVTITMKTIPDYHTLTPTTEIIGTSYMNGSGTSESPYFVYSSHFNDAKTLTLNVSGVSSSDAIYCAVGGASEQLMSGSGTSRTATITLPSSSIAAGKTAVVTVYAKVDGQAPAAGKKASKTVYYTVNTDPVVTVSATYNEVEVGGEIPQNATIVVSATVTQIPGEPTFVYKKGSGVYSAETSYTIPEAGTTTMYAKTSYLGDWTGTKSVTTYAANAVTYVTSKTDMYGDVAVSSTTRLFNSNGEEYTAASIEGYTFTGWTCSNSNVQVSDNGSTWKSTSSNATIYVKATAAGGTLTASYTEKKRIYFDDRNTKWGSVYIYLYNRDISEIWNDYTGAFVKGKYAVYAQMTRIGESDIYYYEYGANTFNHIAFCRHDQHTYEKFSATKVAFRSDFSTCNPVFVSTGVRNAQLNYNTDYYNNGYWRRYMPQKSGYTLHFADQEVAFLPEDPSADAENFKVTVLRSAGTTYPIYVNNSCMSKTWKNSSAITKDNCSNLTLTQTSGTCNFTTTAVGDYVFRLSTANGQVKLTVEYPLSTGDYQVYYTDNTGKNNNYSNYIRKNSSGSTKNDTVSFFVKKTASPTFQIKRCTGFSGSTPTWENVGSATAISVAKDSVYNLIFQQNGTGTTISKVGQEFYSGNYYIRTDGAAGGWGNYLSNPDNKMKHTDKASALAAGYNYYYLRWIGDASGNSTANVKFCIATDYNNCVSQEHGNDPKDGSLSGGQALTGKGANVRFTYHPGTNTTTRTCVGGSAHDSQYLVISGSNLKTSGGGAWSGKQKMNDLNDWIYTYELKAANDATIMLESHYNDKYVTILPTKKVLEVGDALYYDLRIIYDYKTNEVVAAYIPSTVSTELEIDVDIMFIRQAKDNHESAPTTTLTLSDGAKITGDPKTLYGAIKFEKDYVRAEGSYSGLVTRRPERSTYWISFPFDVRIKDIFGLGDYTETWIIQRYRGDSRASKGWFLDTKTFWEYVMDENYVMKAGQGYVLSIDCEAIQWPNNQTTQYLYFPSKDKISDITSVLPSASMNVPEHTCSITSPADRTVKDSHWNVIGIPGFADAWGRATEDVSVIGGNLKYFYTWAPSTNTLSTTSTRKYNFKFMHSYMVQYYGNIDWSASEPAAIVAKRSSGTLQEEVEFCIDLMKDSIKEDNAFVTLMDNNRATTDFDMNTDLVKMLNAKNANIYTIINSDIQAAANCLPMTEQTTIVPVGVQIATNGTYTFTMPDGTNGVSVTLVDNEANTRTNLALTDYTVTLQTGTYDGRFLIEIAPIQQTPTDIDLINGENGEKGVRKMLIDQQMYIIRDGKIYDARGARVQ